MKDLTKIKKFIKDNDLDFTGSDSELNGNCVVLAGFMCYIYNNSETPYGAEEFGRNITKGLKFFGDAANELKRVYDFAYWADYGDFWETDEAKTEYKF